MSNAEHEHTTRIVLGGLLAYIFSGLVICFFWGYAIWVLLKQDRLIEVAIAVILAPLGAVYGFLRFFGFM